MPREHRRAVSGRYQPGLDRGRGSIPKPRPEGLLPEGLLYEAGFLTERETARLLARLLDEVTFEHPTIRIFGRAHRLPRGVAYYGDQGRRYRYSGLEHVSQPWLPALAELRDRIRAQFGLECNAVLVTLYRDGRDRVGWHRDDEVDLVPGAPVIGVSLGASRRMRLRPGPGQPSIGLQLESGSVLVLAGEAQRWQHAIPPVRCAGLRVSLTYRCVEPCAHAP